MVPPGFSMEDDLQALQNFIGYRIAMQKDAGKKKELWRIFRKLTIIVDGKDIGEVNGV